MYCHQFYCIYINEGISFLSKRISKLYFNKSPSGPSTVENGESQLVLSKCSQMVTCLRSLSRKSYSLPSRREVVYEIERTESECPTL